MLSSISRRALASSRGLAGAASRHVRPAVARGFQSGPVLHKSAAAADDDKKLMPADVSFDGPLIRYGLTDWKVYVPLGLAMSVPFLANEWIILSEETQLVAAFVAFGTTVYKFAGGAIAKSLDERQEAIIQEINRLEELELRLYKETIEAAELERTIVEDVAFLDAKSTEMAEKLETTLAGEVKHKVREQFVRWLDAAVAQEKAGKKTMVDAFIDQTAAQVTRNFATDAKLKKAAVDQVIAILKDPKAPVPDLVGAEFEKVGKKVWDDMAKKGEAAASKDGIAAITAELKALKSKKELSESDADAAVKLYYSAFKAGVKPSQLK